MAGRRLGLVIGNNYPNSDKELKFAVADAIKMKEVLENKDICDFDDVVILTNKTSRDVSTELEKLFKNAQQSDLIFIYFSGHGKKDFTNNLNLLFEDTNEELLLSTSISFGFINKCRMYPPALRSSVVIVLDCCYSAAAGMKDTDIMETLNHHSTAGTIIITSTGSTGSPTAMEDDKLGHGIFTYYLIEGLEKGYADENDDGYISIDDLYNYTFRMTSKRGLQSPQRKGNIEGVVFIGKNLLKIKEKEKELKTEKLVKEFGTKLHPSILSESLTILRKNYENPSSMEEAENEIYKLLESFLKGELSVNDYSIAVQHLKGISVTVLTSSIRNNNSIEKLETQNVINTEINKSSKNPHDNISLPFDEIDKVVKEEFNRLSERHITFIVPKKMKVDVSEKIEVNIAENLPQTKERIVNYCLSKGIKVSPCMKASLKGEGGNFYIQKITPDTQPIINEEVSVWEWSIKPLKSGIRKLLLSIDIIIELPQYSDRIYHLKTLEENIEVKVNPSYSLEHYSGAIITIVGIIVTLIIGILTIIYNK